MPLESVACALGSRIAKRCPSLFSLLSVEVISKPTSTSIAHMRDGWGDHQTSHFADRLPASNPIDGNLTAAAFTKLR